MSADIAARMDRMYRPQKHIYDLTRKYYLIGRDLMIAGLDASPGEALLDLGCGTGRNLAAIARRHPGVTLFGLDAATPMLELARTRVPRAILKRGLAEELTLGTFERRFDHITISYCLSMVDDPHRVLRQSVQALAPGGRLHIVDFGAMRQLPGPAAWALRAWLARFGVQPQADLADGLQQGGTLAARQLAGGYAQLLRYRRDRTPPGVDSPPGRC